MGLVYGRMTAVACDPLEAPSHDVTTWVEVEPGTFLPVIRHGCSEKDVSKRERTRAAQRMQGRAGGRIWEEEGWWKLEPTIIEGSRGDLIDHASPAEQEPSQPSASSTAKDQEANGNTPPTGAEIASQMSFRF